MDIARARSPPSLGRRPIGPRSPGKPPGFAPRNIIPLDLSARLQDDIASVQSSPEPSASSSSRAASPALNRVASRPQGQISPTKGDGHERTLSKDSVGSCYGEPEREAPPPPDDTVPPPPPPPTTTTTGSSPSTRPGPAGTLDAPSADTATEAEGAEVTPPTAAAAPSPPPASEPAPPTPRIVPDVHVNDASLHGSEQGHGNHLSSVLVQPVAIAHSRSLSEKSVQVQPPPTPTVLDATSTSTPASTRASTPALVRVVPKRPALAPPPALNFDVEPVPWRGLTLEAAQWSFTSEQLQETVSRAIRHSASESFIRVVPMQTFDVELPQELERLDQFKATTQAQYRFNMSRRTMLLQSLAALSQAQYTDSGDGEALYNLTTQLSDLTVACDRLMETLVRIADQRAQIQHIQDLHIASALSMALRKLNTSYAKRTAELQEERARNEELKAELEEAWSMAQDMAQEMDDLDNFDLAFSDEEMVGEVGVERESEAVHESDALEAEIYNDMDRMSAVGSVRNAEVVEITGKAIATKAMLTTFPGADGHRTGDRTSRVVAAKRRSSRTSKASLRIPKTPTYERGEKPDRASIYSIHSRSRSKSIRRRSERAEVASPAGEDVPEVPVIRVQVPAPRKEGSFLELSETRPVSPAMSTISDLPPPPPPPAVASEPSLPSAAEVQVGQQQSQHASSESFPAPSQGDHPSSISQPIPEEDAQTDPSIPNPPPSPTFDSMSIPTISLQEEPKSTSSGWRPRKFFSRRVQSMQPPLRAADDTSVPPPLKRSISEIKQFDGWPFLGGQKAQRFSVPVLSVIQPLKSRSSSDSAPAASSSRLSSSSSR
ncbi:hypothetical protein BN946_scf184805.g43 [Trametes cinnabarina]|uniref:Uncharacterized protein n=1 Tax=Pycnoporus cinnabarinus TaxID=5643 RepID=A0A060S9A0_PYCCI|nr:hypothetical protein BN946_scf184805.g43 [Trametes cinnabarina]